MPQTQLLTNQSQVRKLPVCVVSQPPLFELPCKETCLCLVTPGNDSGSTSAYPWMWSEGTLQAYWHVCKFNFILAIHIPNVLNQGCATMRYYQAKCT